LFLNLPLPNAAAVESGLPGLKLRAASDLSGNRTRQGNIELAATIQSCPTSLKALSYRSNVTSAGELLAATIISETLL
jgi:hypothetical protein